jgi:glycosyltransferase involved in cell wall biosynthesis
MSSAIYIYGNLDFLGKSAAAKRMQYYAKSLVSDTMKVYLVSCTTTRLVEEDFIETESGIFIHPTKSQTRSLSGSLNFLKNLNRLSASKNSKSIYLLYPQSFFFLEFWSVFYMILYKKHKVFYELNEVKKYYLFLYKSVIKSKTKALLTVFIRKIQFSIMDRFMKYHAGLICISTNIERYGQKFNTNTLRVPILTDPKLEFEPINTQFSTPNVFNIGFSGSIVPKKENLLQFVEVLNSIINRGFEIKFNLCGSVTPENLSLLRKASIQANCIAYYGNLNERELSNFLIQQDLLVVPRGYTLQNKYGFSTKLSDYLNHKKVILVTDISDTAMYIKDGVNGFIVSPDDVREMTEKLSYIITNFNSIEPKMIHQAAITSAKYFDYRHYRSALTTFLQEEA